MAKVDYGKQMFETKMSVVTHLRKSTCSCILKSDDVLWLKVGAVSRENM